MRKYWIGLMGLLSLGVAHAETGEDAFFQAGVHATGYAFDITGRQRPDSDNTGLAGLHLGYRFAPRWALRGWYETGGYEREDGPGEGDLRAVRLSVRRHFPDLELLGFKPHVSVDAADLRTDPDPGSADNETLLGVAFGMAYSPGRRWTLELGGRQTHSLDEKRRDGQLYIGLSRRFGTIGSGPSGDVGAGPSEDGPGFRVKDSDGDGVADPMDDCPGTPAGTEVDGTGCAAGAGESD